VLREGQELDATSLLAWLGDKITRYKLPRRVEFWDSLPKSAYGKLVKKDIRAELSRRDTIAGSGRRA
jgi:acyl-coenzyme A synthetase/AMP-(fatty) acid ligase